MLPDLRPDLLASRPGLKSWPAPPVRDNLPEGASPPASLRRILHAPRQHLWQRVCDNMPEGISSSLPKANLRRTLALPLDSGRLLSCQGSSQGGCPGITSPRPWPSGSKGSCLASIPRTASDNLEFERDCTQYTATVASNPAAHSYKIAMSVLFRNVLSCT